MEKERFIVKFAENDNEKQMTYSLRYHHMLKDFRPELQLQSELDITPADAFAKHAICIDNQTGKVVGCYRIITSDQLPKGERFVCEDEFDISTLKASGESIAELSRAVIHKDYRNSIVLMLLFKFVLKYLLNKNYRFMIGEASFFGTDKNAFTSELSYLAHFHSADEYAIKSLEEKQVSLIPKDQLNQAEIKRNLPPLIRAYLSFGAKTSSDSFTDYDFGSVDVFILLDSKNLNHAFIDRLLR